MNSKHTPGPWIADVDHTVKQAESGAYVVRLLGPAFGSDANVNARHAANAALIAAAPDLLAALRDAIDIINANCAPRVAAAARAAIAKAEGSAQ